MPHAKIASHQAIFTLKQLHAELAGKIIENKREAERLRQSMTHVEAVIKLLNPDYSLRGIAVRRRKPNPWFKRGTIWRAVLDVLRTAPAPRSAAEITAAMLAVKGVREPDRKASADLEGAVRASLRNHEGSGVVAVGDGAPTRWSISSAH